MTPTYRPISVNTPKNRALGRGVSIATGISCSNAVPVDVSTRTTWASACDPRIGNAERRSPEVPQRGTAVGGERPERVVDDHLRDGHRVRAVVQDRRDDRAGFEDDALERQALDRRKADTPHSVGRTGPDDGGKKSRQEHEREERE